jgi:hypothetical protein
MTSETLFDALETCLEALDRGDAVESCLMRYPALAEELRPILISALEARRAAVTEIPAEVVARGKARVLQAAAEMRAERQSQPKAAVLPFWRQKNFFSARFYRLAVTASLMVAFLLTGGTGLVNASSGAIPGDQLYPVKRGWEDVQLAFVFNPQHKVELEHKFDQERVQEIEELYTEGRMEQVHFQGVVQSQTPKFWVIDGLQVAIGEETLFQGEMTVNSLVEVLGETDDGRIKAEQLRLLATPQAYPTGTPTWLPPTLAAPESTHESEDQSGESKAPAGGDQEKQDGEDGSEGIKSIPPPTPGSDLSDDQASFLPTGTPRPGSKDSSDSESEGVNAIPVPGTQTSGSQTGSSEHSSSSSEEEHHSTPYPEPTKVEK